MARGESIPTRFGTDEETIIDDLRRRSGLSRSEIVRRAVRLLRLEVEKRGGSIGFILDDLAPQQSQSQSQSQSAALNEPPAEYGAKKKSR